MGKHHQEYDSIQADPVDEDDGVVALDEEQLGGVNCHKYKLGLEQKRSTVFKVRVGGCLRMCVCVCACAHACVCE